MFWVGPFFRVSRIRGNKKYFNFGLIHVLTFPQAIREWNSLTDSLLSAAEGAEGSVVSSLLL